MAAGGTGNAGRIRAKNSAMAARMKADGVERVIQRCPNCYRIISCEGPKSRYSHLCR